MPDCFLVSFGWSTFTLRQCLSLKTNVFLVGNRWINLASCILSGNLSFNNHGCISFYGLSVMLSPLSLAWNNDPCIFLRFGLLNIKYFRQFTLWKGFFLLLSWQIVLLGVLVQFGHPSLLGLECIVPWNAMLQALLAFSFHWELAVILINFPLYVTWHFFSCSFQCFLCFVYLMF